MKLEIPEDLESDTPVPVTDDHLDALQSRSSFTRPAYSFKGIELWPYTYGYELLFNQVRDAEDTGLYTWLAFVFLLKREPNETVDEHRRWAIALAWKVSGFRDALTNWLDSIGPISTEDKIEAKRIYEENMRAITESSVEPIPQRGARGSQKKTRRAKQS